ncbi:MAG: Gfo/Idh/MocA family oxidoreductase [bacterium]|nr:Gfo/Idh/MocA family oxidoreductase [bacterium]
MKVGLVGCGTVAGYGHLPAIKSIKELELVALSDINETRLKEYGERFGVKNLFTDYREMLDSIELDLVTVSTSLNAHYEVVIESAKRGINVFCEKPLAETTEKGWQMVRAMNEAGKIFAVNFENRAKPYIRRIKDIIKSGELGRPMMMRFIYNWAGGRWAGKERYERLMKEGMGPIVDCGVHYFDLVRWFSEDEFDTITADGIFMEGYEIPDHVVALCRLKSGALVVIDESWVYTHNSKDRTYLLRIDIECEKGIISYQMGPAPREVEFKCYGPNETMIEKSEEEEKPFITMYNDIIKSIKEGKLVNGLASGEDGVKATEYAIKALEDVLIKNSMRR